MNEIFNLENYKNYSINYYVYECDNNDFCKNKRKAQLDRWYSDEFLQKVIDDTLNFCLTLIENNFNKSYTWCDFDLLGDIEYVSLNLTGGWFSDVLYSFEINGIKKIVSLHLLKKFLGPSFRIEEDAHVYEEYDEDDDLLIGAEYSYPYVRIAGDFSMLTEKYEELKVLKQKELIMVLRRKIELGICS